MHRFAAYFQQVSLFSAVQFPLSEAYDLGRTTRSRASWAMLNPLTLTSRAVFNCVSKVISELLWFRVSIEYRKTKTKVITLANQKGRSRHKARENVHA